MLSVITFHKQNTTTDVTIVVDKGAKKQQQLIKRRDPLMMFSFKEAANALSKKTRDQMLRSYDYVVHLRLAYLVGRSRWGRRGVAAVRAPL